MLFSCFFSRTLPIRHFFLLTLSREFLHFSYSNYSIHLLAPKILSPSCPIRPFNPLRSSEMDSSPLLSHVCVSDASPDFHNPSPCDLYRRMVMQEQLVMESTRRSKRRSLVRRGWARVKVTVTKWVDGMNEARGRFLVFLKGYHLQAFLTCPFSPFLRSSPSLPNIVKLAPGPSHLRLLEHFSLNPPQQLHVHLDRSVRRTNEPD